MTNKKNNWKVWIVTPLAVVLCTVWLSSPVLGLSYDPTEIRPWAGETDTPSGEESGWNDTDGMGDEGGWNGTDNIGRRGLVGTLGDFDFYVSKYFFIYFVPKNINQDKHTDHNDPNGNRDTGRSGRTSPQ